MEETPEVLPAAPEPPVEGAVGGPLEPARADEAQAEAGVDQPAAPAEAAAPPIDGAEDEVAPGDAAESGAVESAAQAEVAPDDAAAQAEADLDQTAVPAEAAAPPIDASGEEADPGDAAESGTVESAAQSEATPDDAAIQGETGADQPAVQAEAAPPVDASGEEADPGDAQTAAPAEAEAEPALQATAEPETPADEVSMDELLPATEESAQTADQEEAQLKAVLEALVYITEEPLTLPQIASALNQPTDRIRDLLAQLIAEFDNPMHGITIREIAGGYKMATKPEHHDAVRAFVKSLKPPLKLSLPALETLAVIAYKQPVTGPEIMEIRGVQGAGVLKTLLDRKLIAAAGRKNVIGKPILYKTTKEFLIQFGLKDLAELPTLKEFEELRRLAVDDAAPAPETVMESEPAADTPAAEE